MLICASLVHRARQHRVRLRRWPAAVLWEPANADKAFVVCPLARRLHWHL